MGNTEVEDQNPQIKIDQTAVEIVEKYVFLGKLICSSSLTSEINRKIKLAWSAWMKPHYLQIQSATILTEKNVRPMYTTNYGCETWTIKGKQQQNSQVAQNSHEMLNAWNNKKRSEIKSKK